MVGSVALMRVSSVIAEPSSVSGTLKSARMKTRLLARLMSRIESLGMGASSKKGVRGQGSKIKDQESESRPGINDWKP